MSHVDIDFIPAHSPTQPRNEQLPALIYWRYSERIVEMATQLRLVQVLMHGTLSPLHDYFKVVNLEHY